MLENCFYELLAPLIQLLHQTVQDVLYDLLSGVSEHSLVSFVVFIPVSGKLLEAVLVIQYSILGLARNVNSDRIQVLVLFPLGSLQRSAGIRFMPLDQVQLVVFPYPILDQVVFSDQLVNLIHVVLQHPHLLLFFTFPPFSLLDLLENQDLLE